jgi:hypothetical protein
MPGNRVVSRQAPLAGLRQKTSPSAASNAKGRIAEKLPEGLNRNGFIGVWRRQAKRKVRRGGPPPKPRCCLVDDEKDEGGHAALHTSIPDLFR